MYKEIAALITLIASPVLSPEYCIHINNNYQSFVYNMNIKAESSSKIKENFFMKIDAILLNSDNLKLSEQQFVLVRNISHKIIKELIKTNAEIEIVELEIYENLENNNTNMDQIIKLVDEKHDILSRQNLSMAMAYDCILRNMSGKQKKAVQSMFRLTADPKPAGSLKKMKNYHSI